MFNVYPGWLNWKTKFSSEIERKTSEAKIGCAKTVASGDQINRV